MREGLPSVLNLEVGSLSYERPVIRKYKNVSPYCTDHIGIVS